MMSHCAASWRSNCRPRSVPRLRVTHFLLRASESQTSVSPHSVLVPRRRSESPVFGGSTLITSAPNSPRIVAQCGPAMNVPRSRTRIPFSALIACSRDVLPAQQFLVDLDVHEIDYLPVLVLDRAATI